MKIGYFVERFPELSETFIVGQVAAMHALGHDVEIDALMPGQNSASASAAAHPELLARTKYGEPAPVGRLARTRSAAAIVANWMPYAPAAVLECINPFRYGRQAINLSILQQRLPVHFSMRTYDIVHCHFGPAALRALALRDAGALKGPMLVTFHGYDANLLPRLYGAGMYARLFRHGEFFTVGSKFMRQRLIDLGAPPEKIAILPMGTDLSRFTAPNRGGPSYALRLLTVARLSEVKGIDYALSAIRLLRDRKANVRYRIAGDGPLRKNLEQRARDLGIADIVEFIGAVPHAHIAVLYAEADVFLMPGIVTASGEVEGQGVVLAEAQAAGVPVIASRIGGMPECVPKAADEFLIPQRSPEAIAAAVQKLIVDPELRSTIGRAGRAYVENNFEIATQILRLESLYATLANNGAVQPRPPSPS